MKKKVNTKMSIPKSKSMSKKSKPIIPKISIQTSKMSNQTSKMSNQNFKPNRMSKRIKLKKEVREPQEREAEEPEAEEPEAQVIKEEAIEEEVREAEAREEEARSAATDIQLLRQKSIVSKLRPKKEQGITSCRQLLILKILANTAYDLWTKNGSPAYPSLRGVLSVIWRQVLENSDRTKYVDLKLFFAMNDATAIPSQILTGDGFDFTIKHQDKDKEIEIYPMTLTSPTGTHVFHYFAILKMNGHLFILTAYGSDYLRAHPQQIPLNLEEFNAFIKAGNHLLNYRDNDAEALQIVSDFFRKYFTQDADPRVTFFDEGGGKKGDGGLVRMDREEGILKELESYQNGFQVMFFQDVEKELIAAAEKEIPYLPLFPPRTGGNKKRRNRRMTRRNPNRKS